MTTKTHTRYEVGIKGTHSTFSPDGRKESWSKTYNYTDCLNHIKELRNHVYNGEKIYEHSIFEISTVTEVTTTIEVPNIK